MTLRTRHLLRLAALLPWSLRAAISCGADEPFRPPAVPLLACDPYFSIWSPSDRLPDSATRHWTGRRHALTSVARIDGKPYRLMGDEAGDAPPMPQTGLQVLPTRTLYRFRAEGVELALTFLTPALPEDLEVLSRPLTYLIWEARAVDGSPHEVALYFDAAAEIAVDLPEEEVVWSRPPVPGLEVLRVGSRDQAVLGRRGDDLRIDWGYLYAAASRETPVRAVVASAASSRSRFVAGKPLPEADDPDQPRPAGRGSPVLAFAFEPARVEGTATPARVLALAYDDLYSIRYFGARLRPYWRRTGWEAADLLQAAFRDLPALRERCRAFDDELWADLERAGGERYARIACLAYRQCLAGNKLAADALGEPLYFLKENFSNGCIATVDVFYPMAPQLLLLSPALLKATLVPLLDYAASPRWKFPFAPHDLGTYPVAGGQVYGGGERSEEDQMPVEESGNMLILLAALARAEGGDAVLARRYWPQLARWAEYLKRKGLDPENQLSTDDFAGHLAHNVNLSAKAILALGSFAQLCDLAGKQGEAGAYRVLARDFARRWVEMADDGGRFRLAFDKPGTWSQKYNLVWDRILGLGLFPDEVGQKELRHYRAAQNRYGLPLDSRKGYTKLDWIFWSAAITGRRDDFEALVEPVYRFIQETPDRVPMTDWYETRDARRTGFQARPVVGAVFIWLLLDDAVSRKWAGRAAKVRGEWAPLPAAARLVPLAPTAEREAVRWRYTFEKPAEGWSGPGFDAGGWKAGPGGFGTRGTPGSVVRTEWRGGEIWLRREFSLKAEAALDPLLLLHHDEDAEVYLNGVLAARARGYTTAYEEVEISEAARAALKPGKNLIAIHCRQTTGGQYIDAGLVSREERKR